MQSEGKNPSEDPSITEGSEEKKSSTEDDDIPNTDQEAVTTEENIDVDSKASQNEAVGVSDTNQEMIAPEENSDVDPETSQLEEGLVLEIDDLAENPLALGEGNGERVRDGPENEERARSGTILEVHSFDELKKAIFDAGEDELTIKIMESFSLTETLTIGKNQKIILTADNNKEADEEWEPIKQPADYADQGEDKQREIIEEGRQRGEEALEKADLTKNPLPSEEQGDIIIKRADDFINDTLFKVLGKLTLGTKDTAIYIDGNENAKTAFDNRGSVLDVEGELVMENAVVMNSYNRHGYTAPIKVKDGGSFIMNGGRISSNTSYEMIDGYYYRPTSAGAVYVTPGGSFTMKGGLIDNNNGGLTGGVFAGDFFGSSRDFARVNIEGGIIANNNSNSGFQMGGGITGFPKSQVTITDGIIAGNHSGSGGGVAISDQYISEYRNVIGGEYANISKDYEKFLKENKAEAKIAGGLIYKNSATTGGGVYVDTNHVTFDKTMILDNRASNFGGGIYVSFPPRIQTLEDILITENTARATWIDSFGGGNGGGLWNCPTGYVHIGDGHSIYVFENNADGYGKDITFSRKTWRFELNGKNIGGEFYSHISPVTKDKNIIKFLADGEAGVDIPGNLSYTRFMVHLKALYNEALIKEAWKTQNLCFRQ